MATLSEKIAAKKAAEAAKAAPMQEAPVQETKEEEAHHALHAAEQAAVSAVGTKALTFQEKLALKRAAEQPAKAPSAQSAAVVAAPKPEVQKAEVGPLGNTESAPAPASTAGLTFAEKLALKKGAIASAGSSPMAQAQAKPVREFFIDPARLPDDPETAQGLMDISKRIFDLEELIDDDLARAMSDLKDALRKNPSAAELILDEDVGKMVSSLRRMRHLSVAAATKEKKPAGAKTKPKAKDVALTTEEIAAAWDEL